MAMYQSRVRLAVLMTLAAIGGSAILPSAGAQSITQDVIIDRNPGTGELLEKAVDYSSTRDDVLTVDNEHEGPGGTGDSRGITWYEQPVEPTGPWIAHGMGASYRDVHEISLGQWHNGVPYVLVAEQEQACDPARPEGQPPSHPGVLCRIAMFQWIDGAPQKTVLAWSGTHNQALLPWEGGLLMADSNHGVYGASKAVHLRVITP